MRFEVVITARAKQDIEAASRYIAEIAPDAAERWVSAILKSVSRLEVHPEIWALAAEADNFDFELREFLFRTRSRNATRVLFRIVARSVFVLAIRRPGQAPVTPNELV